MKKKVVIIVMCFISLNILFWKVKFSGNENKIGVYVNDELKDSIPKKGEAMFIKSVCDNNGKASWDNETWGLLVTNMSKKTKCNLYFYSGDTVFNFDYTGGEQVFTVPVSGIYKLETWGAQGGTNAENEIGGYGGYSSGVTAVEKSNSIFINVGGQGTLKNGGYNGGGTASYNGGGGGGATHIATKSGLLSTLEPYKANIIIVSGGGGGAIAHFDNSNIYQSKNSGAGGSGGGIIGNNGTTGGWTTKSGFGGSQNSGGTYGLAYDNSQCGNSGSFGYGGNIFNSNTNHCNQAFQAGGGGGYYGGGSARHSGGGGGSGYIGNHLLKDKTMYCYNCEESSDESTKTISTTCNEETPTENCSKKGNGYARITLISIEE